MEKDTKFADAKSLIRDGKTEEAISIYELLFHSEGDENHTAAYSLGLIYHGGLGGAEKDLNKAEIWYKRSSDMGNQFATYRLAGIYFLQSRFDESFRAYSSISDIDPSAAYWAYRLIKDKKLPVIEGKDSTYYLSLAANQGHILAMREISINMIKGNHGVAKILPGILLMIKLASKSSKHYDNGEKSYYT